VLEVAAERLLPETDTPGAIRCGVGPFIEAQLRDVFELPRQRAFLDGIDALDRAALAAHGQPFPRCTEQQQLGLLEALAKATDSPKPAPDAPEPFIRELRGLSIWALCESQLGATTVLQYEPVPGEFQACVPLAEVGKEWAG
jgi:gluconate 2-dehydrogenase gamma chain